MDGKYLAGITPFPTLTPIPPQTTTSHVHFCSHHPFPLSPDVASKFIWKKPTKTATHNQFKLTHGIKLHTISILFILMTPAFHQVVKNLLKH